MLSQCSMLVYIQAWSIGQEDCPSFARFQKKFKCLIFALVQSTVSSHTDNRGTGSDCCAQIRPVPGKAADRRRASFLAGTPPSDLSLLGNALLCVCLVLTIPGPPPWPKIKQSCSLLTSWTLHRHWLRQFSYPWQLEAAGGVGYLHIRNRDTEASSGHLGSRFPSAEVDLKAAVVILARVVLEYKIGKPDAPS